MTEQGGLSFGHFSSITLRVRLLAVQRAGRDPLAHELELVQGGRVYSGYSGLSAVFANTGRGLL